MTFFCIYGKKGKKAKGELNRQIFKGTMANLVVHILPLSILSWNFHRNLYLCKLWIDLGEDRRRSVLIYGWNKKKRHTSRKTSENTRGMMLFVVCDLSLYMSRSAAGSEVNVWSAGLFGVGYPWIIRVFTC